MLGHSAIKCNANKPSYLQFLKVLQSQYALFCNSSWTELAGVPPGLLLCCAEFLQMANYQSMVHDALFSFIVE